MNGMTKHLTLAVMALILAASSAFADEIGVYNLTMSKEKFLPERIEIPAETKVSIMIDNQGDATEKLNFLVNHERVLPGGKATRLFIGPLEPGEYKFVGIYHPERSFIIIAK
ncbi:MAG: cupredoxin domain-containing protein [Magnetospirillum sp.]|uniref:Putative exported protein n=1 Tax=Paramagnetospirillum magnetotacticum MS-1 TaxID=272627 RepID=A0A0C2YVG8_PARME|nr:cupredoxin domain-containing protein [Paramagnetospirillum magnetotacticum]KIL99093.1 putative exported protein [Paramagnetospirillum magnetotacticum MS-1]MBI3445658.1 cupredoxin domain-containing protein [Magnetospirillum sp.]